MIINQLKIRLITRVSLENRFFYSRVFFLNLIIFVFFVHLIIIFVFFISMKYR